MAELPSRHEQILTILREHQDGLTNREILAIAKKMQGNELPDDTTQMGLNSLALRRKNYIITLESRCITQN